MTTTIVRTYERYDLLANPEGGPVAHLFHRGATDDYGHWYSLCGRVVPSYRSLSLDDTDHQQVCAMCAQRARRRP